MYKRQGRLFSYGDTQRHRLGPNFLQLPVNRSPYVRISNQQRDGKMTYYNQDGAPNYFPNSYGGSQPCINTDTLPFGVHGVVDRFVWFWICTEIAFYKGTFT